MIDVDLIITVIDKEIEWSKYKTNQSNSNVTEEQAEWFIKGLEQAKELINKVNKVCE